MTRLLSHLAAVARAVPGVGFLEDELVGLERVILRQLRHRLDAVAELPLSTGSGGTEVSSANGSAGHLAESTNLAEGMERMLRRSMEQTPLDGRRLLFEHILRELVPDEARILAALGDGAAYPLVDVTVASRGKVIRRPVQNASSVGRAAGVAVPALVPAYVTHLLQLGLAETGREDPALRDEYQILLTETDVRDAQAQGSRTDRRSLRIVRRTVRISALGRDFWMACQSETPNR